jgi:tetratricopeptide (TPR) repeat protein
MDINEEIQSAIQLYQKNNLLQAKNTCGKILGVEPENIFTLHLLGVLLYQLEEYEESIEILGKALKFNPHDPYLYYNYGASLHKQGLMNDATTSFQKAIRLKSDFSDAYYNLGIIFEEMGNLDEAIFNFKNALRYNPATVDVYNNLGNLLHKKGELDDAIFYLNEALKLTPDYLFALNNLGAIFREKGELDKAISVYQKAIEIKPELVDSLYNLTLTLIENNDISKAMVYFQKSLKDNLGHAEIYNLLRNFLKGEVSRNVKFNIMISKRGRKEYLLTCLHYLNLANRNRCDDVDVYISHDDNEILNFDKFDNLKIFYYFIQKEGNFNKSMLLNNSIKHAREDFDIMTFIDLDLIYNDKFFEIIKYLRNSCDYIVTTGYRLPQKESKSIKESLDNFGVIKQLGRYDTYAPPSQISINKKAYSEMIKAAGREQLFNEYYEGWGCEDSELSAISEHLSQKGIIKKTMIHGIWYHLWHESEREKNNFNEDLFKRNVQYLNEFTKKYSIL